MFKKKKGNKRAYILVSIMFRHIANSKISDLMHCGIKKEQNASHNASINGLLFNLTMYQICDIL